MRHGLKALALVLLLSIASTARATVIYDVQFDTFTYNGVTYEGSAFSFESPYFLDKSDDTMTVTLASPITVLGLTISDVGVGMYANDGSFYGLQLPWTGGFDRGALGELLGFFVTIDRQFGETGYFALPGGGGFHDPGFTFVMGTGCLTWGCTNPRDYVRGVSGSVTITDTSVPEPGTLALLGLGLAGLGLSRRRKAA